ncbi:MAG: CoA transferase [Saprospiraceae bacterium]
MQLSAIFKDLKVVELASVLAGPAVGLFFAELGAQVIKIENKKTGGDVTRAWKLPEEDPSQPWSAYYHSVNWHKTSLMLDLSQEEDRAIVLNHIKTADIVISNFKAGSAKKMGMDYQSLRQLNSSLIFAMITAYGTDDPRPGFDVAIQAETGWVHMNGEPNGQPIKMPVALMDILTAHQLKEGILIALLQRAKTGKGCQVTASIFDTGIASLANQAANWLNLGKIPVRMGSQHPNIAPYGEVFYTKDDKALIVAPGTDKQYKSLCDCLGLADLKEDPAFATNALRLARRPELIQRLSVAFKQWPAEVLLRRFDQQQVPVSPIRNLQELFQLPAAQHLVLEEALPNGELSKRVRTVVFGMEGE